MGIDLHPGQSQIFKDMFINKSCRFGTAVCSRGWGKSYAASAYAMTAIDELIKLHVDVPNKNVYIIAPTYDQVTDIYYPILVYEMGIDRFCIRPPRRELGRFQFPNHVELRLLSFEAVERMRGKGAYFVVNDEMSSWYKGSTAKSAWESVIQPAIITRWSEKRAKKFKAPSPGRALTITTPKGYNFVYDMFHYPEVDKLWGSYQFDYTTSPFLDPDEIERIRHTIDPIEFASEYLATFKDSGTNVFYCFDRKVHVRGDLLDFTPPGMAGTEGEDVHVGIDFNVGIQASVFFALRGNQIQILHESQGFPNTEELAQSISKRFEGHRILAYPDPTGKARKSSAPVGQTDLTILRDYGIQVLARSKSPPVIDSVHAVNRQLMTAAGETNMYIHPRCINVIKSVERTQWVDRNPDTATIDKTEGIEHWSDAIRYPTEFLFPVQNSQRKVARGFNF